MKRSYLVNLIVICAVFASSLVFGTISVYRINQFKATSQACALDLMIFGAGGRVIAAIIGPLIIAVYFILVMNYRFKYQFIVKSNDRTKFLLRIIRDTFVGCLIYVAATMMILFAMGVISFGNICNYSESSSLFRDELNITGTPYSHNYSIMVIVFKAFIIDVLEVYVRVLLAVFIYFLSDKGAFCIIAMLGASFVIPFRMSKYMQMWNYQAEAGAFYTEILNNYLYLEGILKVLAVVIVLLIVLFMFVRRKNFYETYTI